MQQLAMIGVRLMGAGRESVAYEVIDAPLQALGEPNGVVQRVGH